MPPKKKVKKTTIFSDEETSEVEDTTAEAPNILEAQKREKAFFDEHKEEKGDELLRNYIEFAKNDKYYKTIFGLDKDGNLLNTPSLEYIKRRQDYYKKYELSDEEESREKNFLRALKDEKNSDVLLNKFQEYVDTDEILQKKFMGKKITVAYVKYLIAKYFEKKETVKDVKENKFLVNILKTLNNSDNVRDKLIEYLDAYGNDIPNSRKIILESLLASNLTDDDIHTMMNEYIIEEASFGSLYFKNYFDEYLKLFNKNPVKFREENTLKKFLEQLLKKLKTYINTSDIVDKYILENKINDELVNSKDTPETTKLLFGRIKLKLDSDFRLYYKVVNIYLKQYLDIKEENKETFKNFNEVYNEFEKSKYLEKYLEMKRIKEEEERKEEARLAALQNIPRRKKEFAKFYTQKKLLDIQQKIPDITDEEILTIYNEPVQSDTIKLAKEKLSETLLKVAKLVEYDINSSYIDDAIEYCKNSSTDTYDLLKKIATIAVYLSDEVNNVVKFKYKTSKYAFNEGTNNIFKNNIKNLFYLPNVLIDLTPSEKLPGIFYNSTISINTRQNILYGINFLINIKIQSYMELLFAFRNLYLHKGKISIKQYNQPPLETVYISKPYKLLTFQDDIENFEEDYVFYNEEYVEDEEIIYKDGKKQLIKVDKNDVYRFLNKDLWEMIRNNNLINPFSGRVFNPQFIKEFEEVYMGKLEEKKKYEKEILSKDQPIYKKAIKEEIIIPNLLELINSELDFIIKGFYKEKEFPLEYKGGEGDVEYKEEEGEPLQEYKEFLSVIITKGKKDYFLVLSNFKSMPIQYIYNITDDILEKDEYDKLITTKDNIREQMLKQKILNPNNLYTMLYFKTNIKPTLIGNENDNDMIVNYIKEYYGNIKNKSKHNIEYFVNTIIPKINYSTFDDIKMLKVIFDTDNKPIISFSSFEENIATDKPKNYIAFMYNYKKKNVLMENLVLFSKEGLYISAVYDINNKDFIDKDEERGILKSIGIDIEKNDDNIYSGIYQQKNKLLNCSNDLVLKYFEEITGNVDIKGKGNIQKYINSTDNSLCINTDKFKVELDSKNIPNFIFDGKDYIDNMDIKCPEKLPTTLQHNFDEGDIDSDVDEESDSGDKNDSGKGESGKSEDSGKDVDKNDSDKGEDSGKGEDSDKGKSGKGEDSDKGESGKYEDSDKSEDKNKLDGTELVRCINCSKTVSRNQSLKSMVGNSNNGDEIHLCCFECFETYDDWPSLKNTHKNKKK